MEFSSSLIKGILIKRYKRFLADIILESGETITAHCPNTGAMTGCAQPGWTVFVRYDPNPKRKLAYTWELSITDNNDWIGVNTHNANKLVAELISAQPDMLDLPSTPFNAERHVLDSRSRFDFVIYDKQENPTHAIEVKSVTLNQNGIGLFPDAVTKRGTKHCEELAALIGKGLQTTLVFCAQHTGIKTVSPAGHIDPDYTKALQKAASAGVKLFAVGCTISPEKINVNQTLPIKL